MNSEIVYAIKQRNHFHKKGDYCRFKIWRQNVRKLICKAKSNYFNEIIYYNKHNPKQLWNSFRELSGFCQTPQSNFIRDDEGNELTDSLLRANLFNDHFTNIHKTVTLTQPVSANNHLPLC